MGESFTLNMGVDHRIKVNYPPLNRVSLDQMRKSKDAKEMKEWKEWRDSKEVKDAHDGWLCSQRIEIANPYDRAIMVEVYEPLPIPQASNIQVSFFVTTEI